ncbi:MAG TPA: hypothetical protein VKT81_05470 [Bryobacteraceae bacterium]|nr:hypothetical protein [Bryobacteraceae bacterium]
MSLGVQITWLFVLALPVACVAWTFTHEEILRETREYCAERSETCRGLLQRKFFYIFTCEYCFSHYVTIALLFLSHYHLLLPDWRGYIIATFAIVWVANFYMGIYGRLRLELKSERIELAKEEKQLSKENQRRGVRTLVQR